MLTAQLWNPENVVPLPLTPNPAEELKGAQDPGSGKEKGEVKRQSQLFTPGGCPRVGERNGKKGEI